MITAVIIDDEEDGRDALRMAIERYCPEVSVLKICETPESGLGSITELKPDLVFLDVQMPNMSGFDVLLKASPVSFEAIFVSAYDKYAIKAIKFSALDYLLKPIDVDELIHAVQKVKERLHRKNNSYQYQSVLNNVQHRSGKIRRLAVPSMEGIDFFDTDDIIYCEADGNYTSVHLVNKSKKLITRRLKDFENILTESGFCRVHNSYLINIRHVQKYVKGEGGYVIMSGGQKVDISRRKKEEFLGLLNKV